MAPEPACSAPIATWPAIFDRHELLLTPVLSEPAVAAGIVEGRGAIATYLGESSWAPFTILWNITGNPAASIPAGHTHDGLPLAVQVIGAPHAEATVLSLAAQLEASRPWTQRKPEVAE